MDWFAANSGFLDHLEDNKGTVATTFWATSDTQLNVKIPSGAMSGPIAVTNTPGTTSSASSLTVN